LNDDVPESDGKWFELSPRIKDRVEFRYHNLAVDPYPALDFGLWGLNLILCRNVLLLAAIVNQLATQVYDE